MWYRLAKLVDDPSKHDNPLANGQGILRRSIITKVEQQIVVVRPHAEVAEIWTCEFRSTGTLHTNQCLLRRTRHGGLVTRRISWRMPVTIALDKALIVILHGDSSTDM